MEKLKQSPSMEKLSNSSSMRSSPSVEKLSGVKESPTEESSSGIKKPQPPSKVSIASATTAKKHSISMDKTSSLSSHATTPDAPADEEDSSTTNVASKISRIQQVQHFLTDSMDDTYVFLD